MRIYLFILFFLLSGPAAWAMGDREAAQTVAASDPLVITRGDVAVATYQVEIAKTPEERAQGLMFRRSLPANGGMLFIYERANPVRMWMKNTYIALDMLFADNRGQITHIHKGALPHDLTPIKGGPAVRYVLEVAAGDVAAKGLQIGDFLAHKEINK